MAAPLRRRPAPAQSAKTEKIEPTTAIKRPVARRRVISIRAVDAPQTAEQASQVVPLSDAQIRASHKAYVPTEEDRAARAEADRQNAVIRRYEERVKNPLTAIRARCIQCSNGQPKEVALCPVTGCALHPFRMGENPNNLRTKAKKAGLTLEEYKAKFGDGAQDEGSDE